MQAISNEAFSLAELDTFDERPRVNGSERRYLCPLCGDGKPRNDAHRCLCANTDSGAWNCKRCDARGKLRDFWASFNPRTARTMARQRRARLSEIEAPPVEDSGECRKYLQGLEPLSQSAEKYLQGRGIALEVATVAGVQFHRNFYGIGAVMFTICDRHGQPVALNGRYTGNTTPKTRTAGPKSNGAFMAPTVCQSGRTFAPLDADAPAIIITEAPMDALALATAGYPALACIGTSGPRWLHIACGLKRVALAFDADEAGDKAAAKIKALLKPYGARCERLRPDGAKDWNEMLQVLGRDYLSDWLAHRVLIEPRG